jgi:outer membrane usher protein
MARRLQPMWNWLLRYASGAVCRPGPSRLCAALAFVAAASMASGQTPPDPTPVASKPVPTVLMPPSTPPTPQAGTGTAERLLPLEVTVNGTKSGTWLLLERLGVLYAPRDAFDEWRVQVRGETQAITYKGTEYLPLTAIPGFGAKVNFGNQSIELTFSPQAFAATRLTTEMNKKPVLSPVMPSFFANYDLNYSTTATRGAATTKDLGILSELGFSNGWGVLTSSYAGRNLTHQDTPGAPRGWVRLESTFTKDLPSHNQTLRLGDASTRAGMWGRSVYFGGVQWGSNFGLTPGFISQPLPVLSGVSAAPSTVELYVNDVLRQVSTVPTGPFAIDNFPALTGGGDARLVVRDLLGRETVISTPFFTSSQLLARGLNDWSAEAGWLRLDLGTASGHYGQGFGSGIWRHGFNDILTLESRLEATRQSQNMGLGLVTGLPWQVLGKAALVASRHQGLGSGHQWLLGFERQSLHTGAYLQVQGASIDFRQLGQDVLALPTKLQLAGNFSYSTEKRGTFGLGFASVSSYDRSRVFTISANFSMPVGERSNVTVTASRAVAGGSGSSIGVNLIVPLEKRMVVTASANVRRGQQDFYATASQSPAPDSALGWRTLAGRQQGQAHAEGGVYYTGRYGGLTGDVSTSTAQTALRLGAAGGMVLADGHFFATRRLDDSFAIAEVAGHANVGIGLGSNVLTHTDAAGVALIPRMSAYQVNSIRLDPKELPISAEIDSIEQTVVPAWRSGVKVVFPVRSGRAALIKIQFDDGQPAPAGATVKIEGDKEEFYVARRGEAFVTGLQQVSRLRLTWKTKQCHFDVTLPAESPEEIVRLGALFCRGVVR